MVNYLPLAPSLLLLPSKPSQMLMLPAPPQPATTAIVQPCMLLESQRLPCDANLLKLEHILKEGKPINGIEMEGETHTVECNVKAAHDPNLSEAQRALLGQDDLLLQAVADYMTEPLEVDPTKSPIKPEAKVGTFLGMTYESSKTAMKEAELQHAKISISGAVVPSCPKHLHTAGFYVISGESKKQPFALSQTNPEISLLAPATDLTAMDDFKGLWIFASPRRRIIQVTLPSCEVRPGSDPVGTLQGRVEILPNDKIEVVIKIPPAANYSRSKFTGTEGLFSREKVVERSSSYAYGVGSGREGASESSRLTTNLKSGEQTSSKSELYSSGYQSDSLSISSGKTDGAEFQKYESSHTTGTAFRSKTETTSIETKQVAASPLYYPYADRESLLYLGEKVATLEEKSQSEIGPNVSVKRNGRELNFTTVINEILHAKSDLEAFFKNLFESKVKVGLTLELEVAVFEGSVVGSWGYLPKAAPENSRIWLVDSYFGLEIQLTVVSVKLSAAYGLEIEIGKTKLGTILSIVAQVFVTVSVEVTLKVGIKFIPQKEYRIPGGVDASMTFGLKGKAKLMGVGYDAQADIKIGLEGKAAMVWSETESFWIEASLGAKQVVGEVWLYGPGLKPRSKTFAWPEENTWKPWERTWLKKNKV